MADVLIAWRTADGEEREERWPNVERFRLWVKAQGLHCTWTAYCQPEQPDEDDEEWVILDQGNL